MRPRLKAAENRRPGRRAMHKPRRFNEAAA